MPHIDARLLPVLTDVERGLRELGLAASQRGRMLVTDGQRAEVFELFRWYHVGTGLRCR